jgi:Na+/proline symporter
MIVGTDLRQVERVTGRLTRGRVAGAGALSGMWLGLFVGLMFTLFDPKSTTWAVLATVAVGAMFGVVWALLGYAATKGRRDFTSVSQVVATRYEVLVEHKLAQAGRELLAKMPGGQTLTA